jgi:tetratricopeptide (TPR) repeat protein
MQSRFILRVVLLFTATMLTLCQNLAEAQRSSRIPSRLSTVEVRISLENERAAPEQLRVQLLTTSSATFGEQFTRDLGQVNFQNVPIGNYRIRVTGVDIEDAEVSFTLDAFEQHHVEFVHVKRKKSAEQTSTEGSVSAATLNIPDKARKEFDKGISGMNKSDYPEAQKHFSKALEIYPQYSAALNNLGVIAMRSGSPDEGRHFFEESIRVDGSNSSGYLNLARCLILQNKLTEAEPLLQKSVNLSPLDAEPLTLLANEQFVTGKLDLALANAHKVHSLEHQRFALAHLIAARILEQENKLEEAAEEYKLFLKESPDSPKATSVRAALQSLEKRVR